MFLRQVCLASKVSLQQVKYRYLIENAGCVSGVARGLAYIPLGWSCNYTIVSCGQGIKQDSFAISGGHIVGSNLIIFTKWHLYVTKGINIGLCVSDEASCLGHQQVLLSCVFGLVSLIKVCVLVSEVKQETERYRMVFIY